MLRWTLAAMTALCLAGAAPAQDAATKSTPVTPAYLWQSGPTYAIARFTEKPDWDVVASLGSLFRRGQLEPPERQTDLRFARVGDTLHIRARCPEGDPAAIPTRRDPDTALWNADSLELLFTQSSERKYPVLHLTVGAHGQVTLARYLLPFGSWATPLTEKPDPAHLEVTTSIDRTGWQTTIVLPLGEYGFTGETFFVNVIRNRSADREGHAWVDLCGGRTHRLDRMGRVTFVDVPPPAPRLRSGQAAPRLKLPASLAVGTNTLQLDHWKAACKLLVNGQPLPVDAQGRAVLRVARHQLVDLDVVDPGGTTVAKYAAEVRRPVLVHCEIPFGNDPSTSLRAGPAKPIPVKLTLNVTGRAAVTVQVVQDGKVVGEHRAALESGEHALAIAHKGTKPGEVEVVARAEVPAGPEPVTVSARHACVVGMEQESFDRFREGIENLPLRSLYRAAVADAGPLLRLVQAGDGKIRGARGRGGYGFSEWSRGAVYLFALLYAADWPENPHRGDVRYLRAAAAGIEEGLDPQRWQQMLDHPPNRGLQGYLLAFDLIRDDLAPDDREYFRKGLERLVETVITTWLDALRTKTSLYSEDIGTSTNHLAYYACDVTIAGRVLKRPEWVTLGAGMMRRLAAHERDGQYPERRDVPAMQYTHLTVQNTALYHALSGPDLSGQVRESLVRSAGFACHTSTPEGEVFGLFDGRNNHHGTPSHGDLSLSLTSTGRGFARVRATQR
ncbi:MAG TPA: hypothetical protein VMX57_02860, partial [Planctomycetota bacterium]|nr:hypothetical protein [Planctomycetota bacterium]